MDYDSAGWYSRYYMPRFDGDAFPQLLTLHLVDALPAELLECWQDELRQLEAVEAETEFRRRLERYLDTGDGEAWLSDPQAAGIAQQALLAGDADLYVLHAWAIMPNHQHALLTLFHPFNLDAVVSTLRKATTRAINEIVSRTGDLWCAAVYAQPIRNEDHFTRTMTYIENNPVKAGLCDSAKDWQWSSVRLRDLARTPINDS